MAKLIRYQPGNQRKLGFRKVKPSREDLMEHQGQLNLFDRAPNQYARLRTIRSRPAGDQSNPFEVALELDDKEDKRAEQYYLEAIDKGISVADAWCNLGILLAKKGETSKSIDAFTKALVIEPRHSESHYNLANMYFDAGNYELAKSHYEIALEIDPDFQEACYNVALSFIALNKPEEAQKWLKRFLALAGAEDQTTARKLLSLLSD